MSKINLRFGAVKQPSDKAGKFDIVFSFARSDADTGEKQAAGSHTIFAQDGAVADKIMAGVSSHRDERKGHGNAKGHPIPDTSENGMLKWNSVTEEQAAKIERHLMDGLPAMAGQIHGVLHEGKGKK